LAVISYISVQKSTFINQTLHHNKFFDAFVYFFIRFSFLLCYEFFSRGVLLYYFLEFHGLILAITFSTGLYLLIHIFDSKKELLGTIPFGIMLCVFTYLTNSIWAAFFFHLTLSAIYEISIFFKSTIKVYKS
jgi:membrane protease YdiL (CAAX protease family)